MTNRQIPTNVLLTQHLIGNERDNQLSEGEDIISLSEKGQVYKIRTKNKTNMYGHTKIRN